MVAPAEDNVVFPENEHLPIVPRHLNLNFFG